MLSLSGNIGLEDAQADQVAKGKKRRGLPMPPAALNVVRECTTAVHRLCCTACNLSFCVVQIAVTGGCAGWMCVSSALILVNKHCMSVDGFAYPMAMSGLGMAFSSVASVICCKVRFPCAQVLAAECVCCEMCLLQPTRTATARAFCSSVAGQR